MSNTKVCTLNKTLLQRVNPGRCFRCGAYFKEGDTVIRRGRSKTERAHFYHQVRIILMYFLVIPEEHWCLKKYGNTYREYMDRTQDG